MRIEKLIAVLLLILTAACGDPPDNTPATPDSTAIREAERQAAIEAQAVVLRDSARVVLATLLADPSTATFDSLVVIQPPPADGRRPPLVACGRINGSPGIGGRRTPTRFVYQNRWTVFVEEEANREQFAELWAKSCGASGAVLIRD